MDISCTKINVLPISKTSIANLIVIDLATDSDLIPFVFDTGASVTVMNKTTAEKFRATETEEILKGGGNAGKIIESKYSFVDSIRIGQCMINKLKIVVVDDKVLDFGIDENGNELKVNGFLGWDIIQHFRWEYNLQNSTLLMDNESDKKYTSPSNMLDWNNMPLINVSMNGNKELFGFDTGNTDSFFGKRIYSLINDDEQSIESIAGVDGVSEESVKNINSLELYINDEKVELTNITVVNRQVFPTDDEDVCGLLGIDIIINKSWVLDYKNRLFELI